jgi:hypothetical protein
MVLNTVLVLAMSSMVHAQSDTLPAPWQSMDIGTVNVPGVAYQDSTGTMTVANGGGDIGWIVADDFYYVYRPWSGDGEITVRLTGMTETHQFAKAGIMFREAVTRESKMAYLYRAAGGGINHLLYRTNTGDSANVAGYRAQPAPYWMKLARYNDTFISYQSTDGVGWSFMAKLDIAMDSVFVGFAVASHDEALICTLTADQISLRNAPEVNTDSTLLAFNAATINDTITDTFYITSIGSAPLVINNVALLGNSVFAVVETIGALTVLPGDSLGLVVRFMPTATGDFTDSFRIVSNDPDAADSVRYVTLTGRGEIASAMARHPGQRLSTRDFTVAFQPTAAELDLRFFLNTPSPAHATIYNQQGILVQDLAKGMFASGAHQLRANTQLPAGICFVRLKTNGSDLVRKVMIVR